jgi:NADPH-dependent curcumin reductase CurA
VTTGGNRRVIFARPPRAADLADCFDFASVAMPEPAPGQVAVKLRYLSIDAYMLPMLKGENPASPIVPGDTMYGRCIGTIVRSRSRLLQEGDTVLGVLPWQDFAVADDGRLERIADDGVPLTAHLGALGQSGITAWAGVVDVARAAPGETFVVSAAAGAVGSCAGQIARIKGCRVVGIVRGTTKRHYVMREFAFDACLDSRAPDFAETLARHADEIDVYFENVGGALLDAMLPRMRRHGRIALCGLVAQYGGDDAVPMRNLAALRRKCVRLEGFGVSDYLHRKADILAEIAGWMRSGLLKHAETLTHGLERAPEALAGLFTGGNLGKQIVVLV